MAGVLSVNGYLVGASGGSGGSGGHEIENSSGVALPQEDTLQFAGYLRATDDSTNDKTVVTDAPEEVTWEQWNNMTDEQKQGHHWIITDAPSPSGDGVQTFAIPTTAWEANSGSDATEFPYVANISSSAFSNDFVPAEVLLLGSSASAYPTTAEQTAIDLVDKYVQFSTSGIRLRATDAPVSALSIVVRGAIFNASNLNDVNQFTISASSWETNAGTDASEFPYVYNIADAGYSDGFIANEILLLGADITDYMTAAEITAKDLVDGQILINSTGIRLRATGEPQSDLTLVIRG